MVWYWHLCSSVIRISFYFAMGTRINNKLIDRYLSTIPVGYIHITYRHTKKRGLLLSKSAIEVVGNHVIEKTCRNPRVHIVQAHTQIGTRKCGYTHEHLLMSCYRIGCEISQVSKHRIASVSKRFVAFGNKVAKADTAPLNQQATCASALPTD